jgi:hypothetical protein
LFTELEVPVRRLGVRGLTILFYLTRGESYQNKGYD